MLISTHHQTGIRSRKITYKYWRQDNPKERYLKQFALQLSFGVHPSVFGVEGPNVVAFPFFSKQDIVTHHSL